MKYLILFTACFFCQISNAQSGIGIETGIVQSRFHVVEGAFDLRELSDKFDHRGFKGKFYYQYNFNKFISIKQSVGFIKRGAIIKRNVGYVSFKKYSIGYIDLSTNVNFSPFNFFTFSGGINYNILTKADLHYRQGRISDNSTLFKKLDLGYNLGVILTSNNFFVRFNYFKSFNPIRISNIVTPIDPEAKDTGYYNNSIEFSIGYHFNLKKKN
ncbi:MAG: hypothetical protein ACI8P3_004367 [Saprospiraceae bacterium]|jgi:hypothetical protein